MTHHPPALPKTPAAHLPAPAVEDRDVLAERLADIPCEPFISLKGHLATPQVFSTCPPDFCEAPRNHSTVGARRDNARRNRIKNQHVGHGGRRTDARPVRLQQCKPATCL